MDGYLLVDKPAGISSFGVVARVRRVLTEAAGHKVKVGHTGTLDPAATGLMILVIGAYCKRAGEFSKLDKTYEVEVTLGATSSTGDIEGEITQENTQRPDETEVRLVLSKFVGTIYQTPPIYSAIKVDGQRAYKLARAGKAVKIEPRKVSIYSIENIEYKYPKLTFTTSVSSGTYVRSLAVDIGAELGTGAFMSALKRTKIANYELFDALELENLNAKIIQSHLKEFAAVRADIIFDDAGSYILMDGHLKSLVVFAFKCLKLFTDLFGKVFAHLLTQVIDHLVALRVWYAQRRTELAVHPFINGFLNLFIRFD